jgi:drug/metabolite transporter (DMT)-like permease
VKYGLYSVKYGLAAVGQTQNGDALVDRQSDIGSSMPTKLLIMAVAANAVLGQLLLKHALGTLGGRTALATMPKFIFDAAASPWIYASLAIQGLGYFLWMILISREKMGVAAAGVGAGFYVLMPLCAWAVYGEALTNIQWFGIALLTVGISCVSLGTA